MRPCFIYDGECAFCQFWLMRWKRHTGDRVEYAAHQNAAASFPHVAYEDFAREAKLIDSDNQIYSGAAAVFRLWSYRSRIGRMLWWNYQYVPACALIANRVYRLIADHRPFFWRLTQLFFRTGK